MVTEIWAPPAHLHQDMMDHMSLLFTDEAFLAYFARELALIEPALAGMTETEATQYGLSFGITLMQNAVIEGMPALPVDRQRRMLELGMGTFRAVDAATCAAMIHNSLPAEDFARIEMEYAYTLPTPVFQDYLAIGREAALARAQELTPIPLNPSEMELAERVFFAHLSKAIDQRPDANALWAALDMQVGGDPVALCDASILIMEVVTSLSGTTGDLVVRFINTP